MKAQYLLVSLPFILLSFGQADAARKSKTKYTNLKAQAVSEILDMLNTQKEQRLEYDAKVQADTEAAEAEAERMKGLSTYRNPKVTPVKTAKRIIPEATEDDEEEYQPNHHHKTGGIGRVGGLGKIGSPNVKAF